MLPDEGIWREPHGAWFAKRSRMAAHALNQRATIALPTVLTALATLLLGASGCGARSELASVNASGGDGALAADSGTETSTSTFPVGTYSTCARGLHAADASALLGSFDFLPGASLTVTGTTATASASSLLATYVDENGARSSFDFVPTSSATATLASSAHIATQFGSICVVGPGSESFGHAEMTAESGALAASGHSIFVFVDGVVDTAATASCGARSSRAGLWITCSMDPGDGPPAPSPVRSDAAAEAFPIGAFACQSQVGAKGDAPGPRFFSADGGDGALVLSREGDVITASYAGDRSLTGTVRFVVATATSALVETGQTFEGRCSAPAPGAAPPFTPTEIAIAAGSLTFDGSTLFLAVTGATASGTPGTCGAATWATTLVCTRST